MVLYKLTATSLPDLPPQPMHPPSHFVFPTHEFGKKETVKQSCQASWFTIWHWLHYHASNPNDVTCVCACTALLSFDKKVYIKNKHRYMRVCEINSNLYPLPDQLQIASTGAAKAQSSGAHTLTMYSCYITKHMALSVDLCYCLNCNIE